MTAKTMIDSDSSPASTTAPEGASGVSSRVPKRRWFWVLYAILLIASVGFAAYQGVRFFRGVKESSRPPVFDSVRRGHGTPGPPAPPPTTGPGEMTDNPLAGVGMTPLKGDPDGIAPPRGADRRSAFVRRVGGEVEMMARYTWKGSADKAAEYYREYLVAKGMKFLGEQTRAGRLAATRPASSPSARPRRIFVFHGSGRHVTVTLRELPGKDGILSITVNLVYPDS